MVKDRENKMNRKKNKLECTEKNRTTERHEDA